MPRAFFATSRWRWMPAARAMGNSCLPGPEEFRKFLDTIEKNVPEELDIHRIMDNYGTHKTKLIQNWLAKRSRFHVHFTPISASWLNLVEPCSRCSPNVNFAAASTASPKN
jgi:transposase